MAGISFVELAIAISVEPLEKRVDEELQTANQHDTES